MECIELYQLFNVEHIEKLLEATSSVTAVHWINDHILGVGFDDASIKIVDVCTSQTIT